MLELSKRWMHGATDEPVRNEMQRPGVLPGGSLGVLCGSMLLAMVALGQTTPVPPTMNVSHSDLEIVVRPGGTAKETFTVNVPVVAGGTNLVYNIGAYTDPSVLPVLSTVGNEGFYQSCAGKYRGNVYQCSQSTTLGVIETYLSLPEPSTLEFVVYEGSASSGEFTLAWREEKEFTTFGTGFYASSATNVNLRQDKFYLIAVGMDDETPGWAYYHSSLSPSSIRATAFGESKGGVELTGYPLEGTASVTLTSVVYYQRLSTSKHWLSADPMTGSIGMGEQGTITVTANATGLRDGAVGVGQLILGGNASNVPQSVNVTMRVQDLVSISHEPLKDRNTPNTAMDVTATVTSEAGMGGGTVNLFWRRLGQPTFTTVEMTQSGANVYTAQIPAQSLGTEIHYYIRATDSAQIVESLPKNAPLSWYLFKIGYPDLSVQALTDTTWEVFAGQIVAMESALQVSNPGYGQIQWISQTIPDLDLRWLSLSPEYGTLNSSQTRNVRMLIDAQKLDPGFSAKGLLEFQSSTGEILEEVPIAINVVEDGNDGRDTATFSSSTNGWTFNAPGGNYTKPAGYHNNGKLSIVTTDNVANFGYWESPKYQVLAQGQTPAEGVIPLIGQTGPDHLYRATFFLRSDVTDRRDAPQFRLRYLASDFQQADLFISESFGDAEVSPDGLLRPYFLYFSPPTTNRFLSVAMDLLNLDPADPLSGVALELEQMTVEKLPTDVLGIPRVEYSADFRGSQTHGWHPIPVEVPDFFSAPVVMEASDQGLVIQASESGGEAPEFHSFGFWETEAPAPVTLEAGRLYQIIAHITTNATGENAFKTPMFRMRVIADSYEAAAYQEINSLGDMSRTPVLGETLEYSLYFPALQGVEGDGLLLAFDYIYVQLQDWDPSIAAILQDVQVVSYPLP